MANFSKHRKYQIGLIELHNLSKGQLADKILKPVFTITGSSNIQLLKFWIFNSSNFQTTFVKKFTKKLPGFKTDFESTDKFLPLHEYIWSEISQQWNNGPLNFFLNLHVRAFCFLNFVKWGKYINLNFADTSKMYCCGLFSWKSKFHR